ncbi:isocitrate lyase/phosphoenolpyruvate mutase family protein [Peterkaempfera bronchialis]|uniref:Phosphoenolpyruvate phosphomutase n=1 Tax=Peterkaempfera bronchialis TaxID=2126346 RepID=A0A345SXV4_9ACTN|nr:isocitrate lyase/phosphoenolpyruvate mutase family protein [Peterkaempfera bronchialis]AXI78559.1 phosphoenolpyruvate phosphomutase [Peterkaempfera bronchialis]
MTTAVSPISPAGRLRAALGDATSSRLPVQAIGAVNAMAARVAAEAGFDALWVSGLEVSAACGLPDENLLGSRDLADVVTSLRRVTDLPVIVDVDNAAGTGPSAARYGFDLLTAGAAAVCLEDSRYPKCNSFSEHRAQGLADTAAVCEQIKELRAAAPELLLIARTETLICGGSMDDALARAELYEAAGADAVLPHSKDISGREALEAARRWGGVPLVTVPTAFPHLDRRLLGEAGFRLAIYANQLSRAALAAMRGAAGAFRATGAFRADQLAGVQDLMRVAAPDARACL